MTKRSAMTALSLWTRPAPAPPANSGRRVLATSASTSKAPCRRLISLTTTRDLPAPGSPITIQSCRPLIVEPLPYISRAISARSAMRSGVSIPSVCSSAAWAARAACTAGVSHHRAPPPRRNCCTLSRVRFTAAFHRAFSSGVSCSSQSSAPPCAAVRLRRSSCIPSRAASITTAGVPAWGTAAGVPAWGTAAGAAPLSTGSPTPTPPGPPRPRASIRAWTSAAALRLISSRAGLSAPAWFQNAGRWALSVSHISGGRSRRTAPAKSS